MGKLIAIMIGCLLLVGGGAELLHWEEGQRLVWDDFAGVPDSSSHMDAHTETRVRVSWNCVDGQLEVDVLARFDREMSWTRNTRSTALLSHEQLHFDLAELCARRVRRYFDVHPHDCSSSGISAELEMLFDEWRTMEARYDDETRHGLDRTQQARWVGIVANELGELESYSASEQER